jgi:hypothetical protein
MIGLLNSVWPAIVDSMAALAAQATTDELTCELPDGRELSLRLRFGQFWGETGADQRRVIEVRLKRLCRAVFHARAELQALQEAPGSRPALLKQVGRWFGSGREADPALVAAVLEVVRRICYGMRNSVLTVRNVFADTSIANGTWLGWLGLGTRYWDEERTERRNMGIMYHEMTHIYAHTTDRAAGAALVYLHEPNGELVFPGKVPEYYSCNPDQEGGVYPPSADLVRLADAHEGFMEESFLN